MCPKKVWISRVGVINLCLNYHTMRLHTCHSFPQKFATSVQDSWCMLNVTYAHTLRHTYNCCSHHTTNRLTKLHRIKKLPSGLSLSYATF